MLRMCGIYSMQRVLQDSKRKATFLEPSIYIRIKAIKVAGYQKRCNFFNKNIKVKVKGI